MVSPGISYHQKSELPEVCLDLVGKVSRGEVASIKSSSSGSSKLLYGLLVGIPGGYDIDISQLFDGNNGISCQLKLLPSSLQI